MIRNILLILISSIWSYHIVSAQKIAYHSVEHKTRCSFDAVMESIYTSYPELDSMHLQFAYGSPDFLILFLNRDPLKAGGRQKVKTTVDLRFKGDLYLLSKQHSQIATLMADTAKMNGLRRIKNKERLCVSLLKDSLAFKELYRPAFLWAAGRKSKIEALERALTDRYTDSFQPLGDSVLIIQAIVERDAKLGYMELFVGEPSPFYDFVKKGLAASGNIWLPFRDGSGSPRRGLVDIYVRLTVDKSIAISVSSQRRKQRIRDQEKTVGVFL